MTNTTRTAIADTPAGLYTDKYGRTVEVFEAPKQINQGMITATSYGTVKDADLDRNIYNPDYLINTDTRTPRRHPDLEIIEAAGTRGPATEDPEQLRGWVAGLSRQLGKRDTVIDELRQKVSRLRRELRHVRRKQYHGCLDAYCPECDKKH